MHIGHGILAHMHKCVSEPVGLVGRLLAPRRVELSTTLPYEFL